MFSPVDFAFLSPLPERFFSFSALQVQTIQFSPHLVPYSTPLFLPFSPSLPLSCLLSLCFSTVHHYLSLRFPLSSITLSHRFPSYYCRICLHLSKSVTHTQVHAHAHVCVWSDDCRCMLVCNLTLLFFCRLECLGLGLPHHTEPLPQPGQRSEHQQI